MILDTRCEIRFTRPVLSVVEGYEIRIKRRGLRVWVCSNHRLRRLGARNGLQTGNVSLLYDIVSLQNGFAGLQNGFADLQNGFADLQNGFADLQNGFAYLQNGNVSLH